MQPAPSHSGPERPAWSERRQAPRYRVSVHMGGMAHLYSLHTSNADALAYQRHMRDIYRSAGLAVFVRKERL